MPDPSETCLRWYECNGVDCEICPLMKEGDTNVQTLAKQLRLQ